MAAARTSSGESSCLLTGMICPSILILIGALQVKNRSEARRSTMSWNSGLVLSIGCEPLLVDLRSATPLTTNGLAAAALGFVLDDHEVAVALDGLVLALALE